MAAQILDGKQVAVDLRKEVSSRLARYTVEHGPIKLVAILVGSDPASKIYAQSQRRRCQQAGIQHELVELSSSITQPELLAHIDRLNADASVTGIMIQLPLPKEIDEAAIQYRIDPYKDVEGVNPSNIGLLFYDHGIIAPCTALAVQELIHRSGVTVRGAEAVVVGQSRIVGRPISMFLGAQMATVTSCHVATRDLPQHTRAADILVVAVGKPNLIPGDWIKPGAVVIDVGINSVHEKGPDGDMIRRTVGDVDFASASDVAGAISPVPGGVGPVTVAMLLRNTVEAAYKQLNREF